MLDPDSLILSRIGRYPDLAVHLARVLPSNELKVLSAANRYWRSICRPIVFQQLHFCDAVALNAAAAHDGSQYTQSIRLQCGPIQLNETIVETIQKYFLSLKRLRIHSTNASPRERLWSFLLTPQFTALTSLYSVTLSGELLFSSTDHVAALERCDYLFFDCGQCWDKIHRARLLSVNIVTAYDIDRLLSKDLSYLREIRVDPVIPIAYRSKLRTALPRTCTYREIIELGFYNYMSLLQQRR